MELLKDVIGGFTPQGHRGYVVMRVKAGPNTEIYRNFDQCTRGKQRPLSSHGLSVDPKRFEEGSPGTTSVGHYR